MGCNVVKDDKPDPLNSDERSFVDNSFKILSQNKAYLKSEDLVRAWSDFVDPEFLQHLRDGCFRKSHNEPINIKQFAKHFNVVVNANVSDKAFYIATRIFDNNPSKPEGVATERIVSFVKSTVRSYFLMVEEKKTEEYQSWVEQNVTIDQRDITNYYEFASNELSPSTFVTLEKLERWLYDQPLFLQLWKEVVIYLYSHMNTQIPPKLVGPRTLPHCNIPERYGPIGSILTIGNIMFINDGLPTQYRRRWTPLFNSKIHGESFTRFVTNICHSGPTILVVRDECGHVFGGFAPTSWTVGPSFLGDLTSILFALNPKLERYITTGYNDHFQYLNRYQHTLPNGLGMGGQYNYWGLWLDENFLTGHTSESCSTFAEYKQMSCNKVFNIRHLEVWSVGEQRYSRDTDESITILADRGVDKFLLELSGREFHTDASGRPNEPV